MGMLDSGLKFLLTDKLGGVVSCVIMMLVISVQLLANIKYVNKNFRIFLNLKNFTGSQSK